jgi:N-acetyl-gamma-glutamyl-phosphate reductase
MAGNRVGIVGVTGYLGGELARVLSSHPGLDLVGAVARNPSGPTLGECCPFLSDVREVRVSRSPEGLDCDLAFLALPPGEAMRTTPGLRARGIRVVDLSEDYRLKDLAKYEQEHGSPHQDPEGLAEAQYGLTELHRTSIRGAQVVANPGCYPTAAILAVHPLAARGLLSGPVVIDAKSGTSGAGAGPTSATHHPAVAGDVHPYGNGSHRHYREILEALPRGAGTPISLTFTPHLIPIVRGLLCSIYLPALQGEPGEEAMSAIREAYAHELFVKVGEIPRIPWVVGSNRCLLGLEPNPGSLTVFSAIDNLLKGGAGQAVQNANLMLGRPEHEGLPAGGMGL